jgi:hypothetical protein
MAFDEQPHLPGIEKARSLKKRKTAQQSVHLTGGILRHFRAFSTPEQNPALGANPRPPASR